MITGAQEELQCCFLLSDASAVKVMKSMYIKKYKKSSYWSQFCHTSVTFFSDYTLNDGEKWWLCGNLFHFLCKIDKYNSVFWGS